MNIRLYSCLFKETVYLNMAKNKSIPITMKLGRF